MKKENKEKVILESFVKIFNKIKRLEESTLDEINYEKVYSDVNPWDKQSVKIDDYPAEGKMLDMNVRSAELAVNGDREHRHRFLMDDNELRTYLGKLHKIKNALDKSNAGEELDDFEKKVVRFYKSNKQSQKARISNMAGDKLDSNFVKNFDKSAFNEFLTGKGIGISSRNPENKGRSECFLKDIKAEKTNSRDVKLVGTCTINGRVGTFDIYQDGSNGFKGEGDEYTDEFRQYYIYDEGFRNIATKMLYKIRPERNY